MLGVVSRNEHRPAQGHAGGAFLALAIEEKHVL